MQRLEIVLCCAIAGAAFAASCSSSNATGDGGCSDTTCRVDSDCCPGTGNCVNGACTLAGTAGSSTGGNSGGGTSGGSTGGSSGGDVAVGQPCTGTTEDNNCSSQYCPSVDGGTNVCACNKAHPSDPYPCKVASDCCTGAVCTASFCVAEGTSGGSSGGTSSATGGTSGGLSSVGQACTVGTNCSSDYCKAVDGGMVCACNKANATKPYPCAQASDCCTGAVCSGDFCVAPGGSTGGSSGGSTGKVSSGSSGSSAAGSTGGSPGTTGSSGAGSSGGSSVGGSSSGGNSTSAGASTGAATGGGTTTSGGSSGGTTGGTLPGDTCTQCGDSTACNGQDDCVCDPTDTTCSNPNGFCAVDCYDPGMGGGNQTLCTGSTLCIEVTDYAGGGDDGMGDDYVCYPASGTCVGPSPADTCNVCQTASTCGTGGACACDGNDLQCAAANGYCALDCFADAGVCTGLTECVPLPDFAGGAGDDGAGNDYICYPDSNTCVVPLPGDTCSPCFGATGVGAQELCNTAEDCVCDPGGACGANGYCAADCSNGNGGGDPTLCPTGTQCAQVPDFYTTGTSDYACYPTGDMCAGLVCLQFGSPCASGANCCSTNCDSVNGCD